MSLCILLVYFSVVQDYPNTSFKLASQALHLSTHLHTHITASVRLCVHIAGWLDGLVTTEYMLKGCNGYKHIKVLM